MSFFSVIRYKIVFILDFFKNAENDFRLSGSYVKMIGNRCSNGTTGRYES
jgi:hypothetical protein